METVERTKIFDALTNASEYIRLLEDELHKNKIPIPPTNQGDQDPLDALEEAKELI